MRVFFCYAATMSPVRRQVSPHASRLRRDMTDVERRLWSELRDRKLHGLKFRRQARIGRYMVDFLCIEARLVVELDGGQHRPAHPTPDAAGSPETERAGMSVSP